MLPKAIVALPSEVKAVTMLPYLFPASSQMLTPVTLVLAIYPLLCRVIPETATSPPLAAKLTLKTELKMEPSGIVPAAGLSAAKPTVTVPVELTVPVVAVVVAVELVPLTAAKIAVI